MESLDQLVQRLAIELKVPKIDDKELVSATYILIRHAYSDYNFTAQEVEAAYGEHSSEMKLLKGDPNMYDPGLHPIG